MCSARGNFRWCLITCHFSFYSILFETSICQFNSSKCSPITPDEVREHLTRDQRHSFIQNHFRFTDPWRCFFSSSHSCSTGFRSEDWNGRSRSLVLCSVTHFYVVFEVCVWIIVQLDDPNMAHYKIYNRVSHLLIFICWYLIESMMHVSKDVQTSSRNIDHTHQKYSSIFNCTHDGVLLSLCSLNSSWVFAFFI